MTPKQPFGSDRVSNGSDNDTPQQKKFEQATGKDSDSAVGDVAHRTDEPATDPSASGVDAPKGLNKDVWAEAERATVNMLGGFAGVGPEGREKQIRERYDQMVQNDKDTKEWADHSDGPGGLLGDTK